MYIQLPISKGRGRNGFAFFVTGIQMEKSTRIFWEGRARLRLAPTKSED